MKVIDMRCRPAFLHDFFGATPGSAAHDTARWLNRRVGTIGNDAHFERSLTQAGFLDEVRDAGVTHAVVVGRHTPSQHLPNEKIHEIVHNHRELIGIAAVDPSIQGELGAIEAATYAIRELGLAGLDLEPGFCEPARHPDDPIYWPVYELASQLQVPIFLMSGPTTPDPRFNDPAAVAKVAQAFPQLPIVIYHGYWPNVHQAIGLAFRYENIKLVPDMYLFQPGSDVYIQAANSFMSGQLLFGSSYPFRPIGQSIDDIAKLGLKESAIEDVLYNNAATLFQLEA